MDGLEDIIPTLGKVLSSLEKLNEQRGVPKEQQLAASNITNSSIAGKSEKPLRTDEKRKLTEVFTLFSQVFFDYQKKMSADEKPETLIGQISDKQQRQVQAISSAEEKKSGGLFSFIGSMFKNLTPVILGVVGFAASLMTILGAFFTDVGPVADAAKAIGKIGMMAVLKLLGSTFLKRLALPILKKLPFIGGIISLGFAYKEFKAGRLIPGVIELISGILNFVPVVGPFLSIGVDILKAFLDAKGMFGEEGALGNKNAIGTIKGWMSNIGNFITQNALNLPIIATIVRMKMAWDEFSSGNYGEGFKQIFYGLVSVLGGGEYIVNGIEWLVSFFQGERQESPSELAGGVMDTIKGWISGIGNFITENALYLPIIGGIQRFGMSWDAFGSGEWGEGFKQLALGIITFIGGGPIVAGFEMLHGWLFGGEKESETEFNSKPGWFSRLKGWIKGKLQKLPYVLRKPLEWLGILEDSDSNDVQQEVQSTGEEGSKKIEEKSKGFFSSMADSIGEGVSAIGDFVGDMWGGLKELGKNAMEKLKTISNGILTGLLEMLNKSQSKAKELREEFLREVKNYKIKDSAYEKVKDTFLKAGSALKEMGDKAVEAIFDPKISPNKNIELLSEISNNAKLQTQLLTKLVEISDLTYQQIKSKGSSSSSAIPTPVMIPSGQGSPLTTFNNNRSGYSGSVYAL